MTANLTTNITAKMINILMTSGKKSVSRTIVYKALKLVPNYPKMLSVAMSNVKPILEVRKKRIAGKNYEIPALLPLQRQHKLAIRWILDAAVQRRLNSGKGLDACLAAEIIDAAHKQGLARKKRDDLHKKAEANRAFANRRWW